ncbi:transmembrane protein 199-like [Saccostrea echinata]|uniref:transmembrane protein 199-like n=1 Tax=Saccostrea echinata TaxID=191078 RepID=UPI002A7F1241|nr:transmembrane protein 199-like [Saccostrea echinata]
MESMEPAVILTEKIKSKLTVFLDHNEASENSKEIQNMLSTEGSRFIPFRLIKYAFDKHQCIGETKEYLNEWLEGSILHIPAYEPPERNQELEARIQRLKAEQANRDYKAMVRSVDKEQKMERENIGAEVKAMNTHIWSFINFVITVVGAFAFGYKATEYTFSGGNAFIAQMVTGLIFATIVFFADLYFMVKQIS